MTSNDAENLTKIKFDNFEQCGSKVGGGALLVHFWGLPPSGVRTPIRPMFLIALPTLRKMVFVWGGIDPHLGEIWGFEI